MNVDKNHLLCFHGPFGSGKTRLLMNMERTLAERPGGLALQGACPPHGANAEEKKR